MTRTTTEQALAAILRLSRTNAASYPALAFSSIEDGSIVENDADGVPVAVIGKQDDGSHGAVALTGPIPPQPQGPNGAAGGIKTVSIPWNGFFVDAARPLDLHFVDVLLSTAPDMSNPTTVGSLVTSGAIVAASSVGVRYVALQAESMPGRRGPISDIVQVSVSDIPAGQDYTDDFLLINDALADHDDRIADATGFALDAQDAAGIAQGAANAANAAVAAAIAQGQSLVVNGDYEAGDTGWGVNTQSFTRVPTLAARSGSKVMLLNPTTGNTWPVSGWTPSASGRSYYIQAYFRKIGTSALSTDTIGFVAQSNTSTNTFSTPVVGTTNAVALSTTVWTKISATHTIADTVDATRIRFAAWARQSTNDYEVDDLLVIDVTEAVAATKRADDAFTLAGNASEAAGLAQQSANGKNTVWKQATTPPGTGHTVGDVWWKQIEIGEPIEGQYQWTGNTWAETLLGHQILASIDLGKATIGELDGIYIKAKSIRADALLIGVGQNMLKDPNFEDDGLNALRKNAWSIGTSTTDGKFLTNAGSSVVMDAHLVNSSAEYFDVDPGGSYALTIDAESPAGRLQAYLSVYYADGGFSTGNTIRTFVTTGARARTTVEWDMATLGAIKGSSVLRMAVRLRRLAGVAADANVYSARIANMTQGEVIINGTVTALKLDVEDIWANQAFINKAILNTATFLTNVDGSGNTSTVTGNGLLVQYTDPTTGEVQDRVRVGTWGDDFFALTNDMNEITTSIDKDGHISAESMSINGELSINGDTLEETLSLLGGKVIAYVDRDTDAVEAAANIYLVPYLRLNFNAKAGRFYRVWTSPINMACSGTSLGATTFLHYRDESEGGDATTSSRKISSGKHALASGSEMTPVTFNRFIRPVIDTEVSLLISFVAAGSFSDNRARIKADSERPIILAVEDLGSKVPETGDWLDGPAIPGEAPAPPPAKKTYVYETGSSNRRSYLGNGGTYAYQPSKGYQGLQPGTGNGNLKSIWTFPSVTGILSGATVNDIWAYFYFEHWYYNNGGKAIIRMHGNTTVPSSYNGLPNGMDSSSWRVASGRWVRVPSSLYAGWKSGTYKGFALAGDGTFNTYGIARSCRLKIRYTK